MQVIDKATSSLYTVGLRPPATRGRSFSLQHYNKLSANLREATLHQSQTWLTEGCYCSTYADLAQ